MEAIDEEAGVAVEDERLKAILESLLFAAGEPVTLTQLANALDTIPREQIRKALAEMATAYSSGRGGLVLEEIAGGYQLRTPREHALYVRRLLAAKPPRLSRPLLETLAIIAYRQPITRAEIEQLRGVDTGGVLETLTERGLIKINGRKDAPGRPIIYVTTPDFLELFALKDLESLPDLKEFRELEALQDSPSSRAIPPPSEEDREPALGDTSGLGEQGAEVSSRVSNSPDTPASPGSMSLDATVQVPQEEPSEMVSTSSAPLGNADEIPESSAEPIDEQANADDEAEVE